MLTVAEFGVGPTVGLRIAFQWAAHGQQQTTTNSPRKPPYNAIGTINGLARFGKSFNAVWLLARKADYPFRADCTTQ